MSFVVTLILAVRQGNQVEEEPLLSSSGGSSSSTKHTLLIEELSNIHTFYSPFLDTWPLDFSYHPLLWSNDEMNYMEGSCTAAYIEKKLKELEAIWIHVYEPVLCDKDIVDSTNNKTMMHQLFLYSFAAVYSRSHADKPSFHEEDPRFRGIPISAIYPLIDIFNGERDVALQNGALNGAQSSDGDMVIAYALRNIKAGEELVMSYGDQPNRVYLAKFGFLPLQSGLPVLHPADIVCLRVPSEILPDRQDAMWWIYINKHGFMKERLEEQEYFSNPFFLSAIEKDIRHYRRLPETCEWGEGTPAPYLRTLMDFSLTMLANENALKGIPLDPYLETWETSKFVVEKVIDYAFGKLHLPASSVFHMNELIRQTQETTGILRVAAMARMIDCEILLKWRHAICVRNFIYEDPGSGIIPVPQNPHEGCSACKTSFRLKRCLRCKKVSYCSKQCQKDDWKLRHKDQCVVVQS